MVECKSIIQLQKLLVLIGRVIVNDEFLVKIEPKTSTFSKITYNLLQSKVDSATMMNAISEIDITSFINQFLLEMCTEKARKYFENSIYGKPFKRTFCDPRNLQALIQLCIIFQSCLFSLPSEYFECTIDKFLQLEELEENVEIILELKKYHYSTTLFIDSIMKMYLFFLIIQR